MKNNLTLLERVERTGITKSKLASILGYDRPYISQVLREKRVPGKLLKKKITRILDDLEKVIKKHTN